LLSTSGAPTIKLKISVTEQELPDGGPPQRAVMTYGPLVLINAAGCMLLGLAFVLCAAPVAVRKLADLRSTDVDGVFRRGQL